MIFEYPIFLNTLYASLISLYASLIVKSYHQSYQSCISSLFLFLSKYIHTLGMFSRTIFIIESLIIKNCVNIYEIVTINFVSSLVRKGVS